jgi:hypothetical protein
MQDIAFAADSGLKLSVSWRRGTIGRIKAKPLRFKDLDNGEGYSASLVIVCPKACQIVTPKNTFTRQQDQILEVHTTFPIDMHRLQSVENEETTEEY